MCDDLTVWPGQPVNALPLLPTFLDMPHPYCAKIKEILLKFRSIGEFYGVA